MEDVYEYEVEIDKEVHITHYEDFLSKLPGWVEFKREIRLINILDGKKIEYSIDDIRVTNNGLFGLIISEVFLPSIDVPSKIVFVVRNLKFIINSNLVEKLTIKISFISANEENICKSIIESNLNFKIKQYIEDSKFRYFYIQSPELPKISDSFSKN
jgi:hypothetical protein